jgi:hypothetical protein
MSRSTNHSINFEQSKILMKKKKKKRTSKSITDKRREEILNIFYLIKGLIKNEKKKRKM